MKTLLSWSGGKDSALALAALRLDRTYEVVGLLTTVSEQHQRVSMHGVRVDLMREQAMRLGLPLITIAMPPYRNFASPNPDTCPIDLPSNNTYEQTMLAAFADARNSGIEAIAFGDIYLEDLRRYRDVLLAQSGMRGVYPLWQRGTVELLREFITNGWRAVVVCTDDQRLAPTWVGREIDSRFAADLPENVDPCGERGEYHSFVYDGPLFAEAVPFTRSHVVTRAPFTFCDLLPDAKREAVAS
jgi:uncharacterized protein (TIGR00290 family)